MKVMLLAAGKGTRMLPLTQHTPKPLLQAGGRSLIEHQLRKLQAAGFRDCVINHAWLGAQIEAALGDGQQLGLNIQWSREDEPLETAGGIVQALPLLGAEPFAVVNADVWTDYPFARLRTVLQPGRWAHLVLVPNPPQHPQGDFVLLPEGRPALRETAQEQAHTFSGIAVYHPALFAAVTERKCALLPLLQQAIRSGRASAELYNGVWQDIGTPERLQALDLSLQGKPDRSNA
jgi:MurNAc alpha-1-phosphate uridylyltransferase